MALSDSISEQLPSLDHFDYELPEDRIARHPVGDRATARMLVYRQGAISHHRFQELPDWLPQRSVLVSNNTRVVRARLPFYRKSGGRIEVFCLDPVEPHAAVERAMQAQGQAVWRCLVRNLKKWQASETLRMPLPELKGSLDARLILRQEDKAQVEFTWTPAPTPFAEVLEAAGRIPLPPYLQREEEPSDQDDYQTVYASRSGAVAAPTAGLHFNQGLIQAVQQADHQWAELTLHVGAGTFQPVTSERIVDHAMHQEEMSITRSTLDQLLQRPQPWVAVGTTSLRTLESLYWLGHQLIIGGADRLSPEQPFYIPKLYPYHFENTALPSREEAFSAVRDFMSAHHLPVISGKTEIFIFPGYHFHALDALITNFHQPRSTLIMLIAAWLGPDWKKVYQAALEGSYRFLSFGDGSLLFPGRSSA